MLNKPLIRGLFVVLAVVGGVVQAVPAAQASVEHPQFYVSAEFDKNHKKIPYLGWATVKLSSRALGEAECVNITFGDFNNETEPGHSTERAYGEVLEWTATGHANSKGLATEMTANCSSSSGYQTWAAVEPELEEQFEKAKVEGTERIVIKHVQRFPPSVPWRQEATGLDTEGKEKYFVKTGIASSEPERLAVEAEEAKAGIATERRTGCYPQPPLTELVREPGFTHPRETELVVRPAPQGCIRLDWVVPAIAFETTFQGTLEPEWISGVKNALTPSHMEYKGGFVGPTELEPSERSSERNERQLVTAFGPVYYGTLITDKLFGFLNEAQLQIK